MIPQFPVVQIGQGFAHPSLSDQHMMTAVKGVLTPEALKAGAGRGLVGSAFGVLAANSAIELEDGRKLPDGVRLPDYVALAAFKDLDSYKAIMAGPAGQRWMRHHYRLDGVGDAELEGRDLFVRETAEGRKSDHVVAEKRFLNPAFGKAYGVVMGELAQWQGAMYFSVRVRNPGVPDDQYIPAVGYHLDGSALLGNIANWHFVRLEEDYILDFWGMKQDRDQDYKEIKDISLDTMGGVSRMVSNGPNVLRALTANDVRRGEFALNRGDGYRMVFKSGPLR